uniref:Uncharacterized protein n=1 Tax=viral metagenome TaxID=1070528 RepID=A0A6C0DSU2_9ZZZZ
MAARRIRSEREHQRAIADLYYKWDRNDESLEWWIQQYEKRLRAPLRHVIEERVFTTLRDRYERRLKEGRSTVHEIEAIIWGDAKLPSVGERLWSMLDVWERQWPSPPKSELQTLVTDSQNVHTRVVIKQTHKSMGLLVGQVVPAGQRTTDEILTAWMTTRTWAACKPLYEDMVIWGGTATIYVDDDYLYRKTLRSLWALIKSYHGEVYDELVNRLWEECNESIGVCAQGHITRLANVMVGFHEEFLSPQCSKEQFQDKMSAIAASTRPLPEKIAEARLIMDEHAVPEGERAAWFEAFD